jgi:dipeptidase D
MTHIFEKQNKKKMKIEIIHAGLECGWFIQRNPNLDMVSIGVTAIDIHSPKERLQLDTVALQVKLIMEVLTQIKNA